jgi:hypothetical protein
MNSGTAVWDLSRENTGEKRDSAFLQERGISVGVGACEPAIRSISSSLGIFFVWTFATNQATNNWTVVPKNWNTLRMQWEYSHAANAVVMFAALACVVISVLRQPSQAR